MRHETQLFTRIRPTALYVQAGLDRPLSRLTGPVSGPSATAHYYHPNGLDSVLALTNASAAVTGTQRFDAFGTKLAGTGAVPQYGYTGREPDATGARLLPRAVLRPERRPVYRPRSDRLPRRDQPVCLCGQQSHQLHRSRWAAGAAGWGRGWI